MTGDGNFQALSRQAHASRGKPLRRIFSSRSTKSGTNWPPDCLPYMESSPHFDSERELALQPSHNDSTLAKPLAPEEIGTGDFITLLHEYFEMPSYYWCSDSALAARDEVVRVRYLPSAHAGTPFRVRSICLPFVLLKHPNGEERPIDLRKYRVARLSASYALRAWKAYRKSADTRRASQEAAGDTWPGVVSTDDIA